MTQEETDWKELVLRTKQKLEEANEFIQKVTAPPFLTGIVVNYNKASESADVSVDGKIFEVNYIPGVSKRLKSGVSVRLNPETKVIMDVRKSNRTGVLTTVSEVLSNSTAIVEEAGVKRVILTTAKVSEGDRVIVDEGFHVVIKNLGKKSTQYHLQETPFVPWSKIGGLESVISSIRECVEEPFVHRKIYERYGKIAPKGVLLYGPSGCGKTLLAKGIAYNLAERLREEHTEKSNNLNAKSNGYFISVKGPELLNKYVGNSEDRIREIFSRARDSSKQRGDVTVLFFDEAESLLKNRGSGISSDIYDSIVAQFLSEMDGMDNNENMVVVLATNRPDIIDPAVLRPGRIDRKIRVGRPNHRAVEDIFNIYLSGMPIYDGKHTTASLATYARDRLFSDEYPLFEVHFNEGNHSIVRLGHLTSGAMIKSISGLAAGKAIKREIKSGKEGLMEKDLSDSVIDTYQGYRAIASIGSDDLLDFFSKRYNSIKHIARCN